MASSLGALAAGSDLEVSRLERKGLAPGVVDEVADLFGIPKTRLLSALGLSATTVARKARANARLDRDESESLTRLVRLHAHAATALAQPNDWFLDANPLLDGEAPLDAAGTEAGGRAVRAKSVHVR